MILGKCSLNSCQEYEVKININLTVYLNFEIMKLVGPGGHDGLKDFLGTSNHSFNFPLIFWDYVV